MSDTYQSGLLAPQIPRSQYLAQALQSLGQSPQQQASAQSNADFQTLMRFAQQRQQRRQAQMQTPIGLDNWLGRQQAQPQPDMSVDPTLASIGDAQLNANPSLQSIGGNPFAQGLPGLARAIGYKLAGRGFMP